MLKLFHYQLICLSYRKNTSILATVQGGGSNRTHNLTNTKVRYPKNIYVEGINNIESWTFKKSKDKITRYGQDWYWCPN